MHPKKIKKELEEIVSDIFSLEISYSYGDYYSIVMRGKIKLGENEDVLIIDLEEGQCMCEIYLPINLIDEFQVSPKEEFIVTQKIFISMEN